MFLILERNVCMFYVQNFIILCGVLVLLAVFLTPKRYKNIRRHSSKKRDYRVQYAYNRKHFHKMLMSKDRHLSGISDGTDMVLSKKQFGKVVGAFVYMNYDLLQRNKQLIKDGVIKRNAKERQSYSAPHMDLVKDKVVDTGSGKTSLYHLTHLISFRHSLSEGDFDGLLFAGTAHLNSGARYDLDYAPPYSRTSDSTLSRVNSLKDHFFNNGFQIIMDYPTVKTNRDFGNKGAAQYSLNEFELLLDFFVNWKKDHVFKYGVECFYEKGSPLVHHVNVIIIDVTAGKLLVNVMLMNRL